MPSKIRILIAEDQRLFAHMLKVVLETRSEDFEVLAIAPDGAQALDLFERLNPDVLLLDLKMPVLNGVDCAKELLSRNPLARILVLTTFDDQADVHETIEAGVAGYILKDCEPEVLFTAVRTVHSGASSVSPLILKKLAEARVLPDPRKQGTGQESLVGQLNRREFEILAALAEGLDNKEISERLFIAEQTVKNNISSLYEKLGVKERPKLMKIAEAFVASLSEKKD